MIPAEAVEAAAKLIYHTSGRKRVMSYEQARPTCEDEAQLILDAAAPHMLGEALRLADKWQENFPYKANELRAALGVKPCER